MSTRQTRMRAFALAGTMALATTAALAVTAATACGGSKDSVTAKTSNDLTPEQIDADALALLPGSPIAVANVDARAFYGSDTLGGQIGKITEKLLPLGAEAGFVPSRDVDRVVAATYSLQGIDVAAVVTGRFDKDKISKLAQNHTPTKNGGLVVESTYAGRTLFTVNNAGFVILTPHTALAGTETGIRRALDRIKDGRVTRSIKPWIIETLESKGAATAFAADLEGQPIDASALGSMQVPWLVGLKAARILGNFHEPGMSVAGSLTYDNEDHARAGADGVKQVSQIAAVLAVGGIVPSLQNLEVTAEKTSVQYKFAVDDQGLRSLLSRLPSLIGG
jgi:hypothetical protein